MPVDVDTEIVIDRPRDEVAAYAGDLTNAPEWYTNLRGLEWKTEPPVGVGSQVEFIAMFLGRELQFVFEIREWVPGERLVMASAEGPFPLETTFAWEDHTAGGTRMRLRNRGDVAETGLDAPVVSRQMEKAMGNDLKRIKRILERR